MRDDESLIWLEGLVGQTNRLVLGVVPGSARITVGNLYTTVFARNLDANIFGLLFSIDIYK